MPKTFRAVAVKYPPDIFDSKRVSMTVLNAEKKVAVKMVDDLRSTVEYWKGKPDFDYRMHYAGGNVYLDMVMTGSRRGALHWKLVNEGTAAKNVVFNRDYEPKTFYDPSSFHSNWYGVHTTPREKIKYRLLFPQPPGIHARNWSTLLTNTYRNEFALAVNDAIKRGLQPK